jgi:hypothetical protein
MKWVESWYISYALLGLSAAGLVPILLPLFIGRTKGATGIGFVVAAFNLGGLTAPIWGTCMVLAQREQHGTGCFPVSGKRGRGDGRI